MNDATGPTEQLGSWNGAFVEMANQWSAIAPAGPELADLDAWGETFARMRSREEALRSAGLWISGPSDLLRIARVVDGELVHSNVVGWLLDPTARHGLGDQLLARILAAGWPEAD